MSGNPEKIALPDARDRQIAVGTFDHNLVVTAGAGTGKTTLLVDRLAHLILRDPEPLKITEIVALTFTNKAADEMKLRLRERLQTYLAVELDRQPESDAERKTFHAVEELIALYRLSKDDMDGRIREALRNLERSDIGTIHSFAANLLRLYPIEAGVDPQFREDEGSEFDRLFDEQWDAWLDQELALASPRAEDWRKVLARCQLDQIKALARSLSAETVELKQEPAQGIAAPLRDWLGKLAAQAAALDARHPEDRMNEKLVRAAHAVIYEFEKSGRRSEDLTECYKLLAEKSVSRSLKGWSAEDIAAAQELVRAAKGLAGVDGEFTALLWRLLTPYAEAFRERFLRDGHISFDGLLVRARNLVRDHQRVRAELKRRYRTILIDEFQDTDPIQYEILLYLAEQPDQSVSDWRKVKLAPGKLFVVGDPKQSIYAFRRADIEAYLEVVEKIVMAQDGIECRLTTNFRSDGAILDVVNGAFEKLIQRPSRLAAALHRHRARAGTRKHLRPAGKTLGAKNHRARGSDRCRNRSAHRRRKLGALVERIGVGQGADSQCPRRDRPRPTQRRRHPDAQVDRHSRLLGTVSPPGHPLRRRRRAPFLRRQRNHRRGELTARGGESLRSLGAGRRAAFAVGRPHRSADLPAAPAKPARLSRQRQARRQGVPGNAGRTFIVALTRLNVETRTLPIGAAVDRIFSTLPVELLAACHFHGEQAVANLAKLRQQAEQLGREGLTTLKAAIRQLEQRVLDVKDEGESVLAEENLDAVRIMSIHKSKGLEFPIVILAGCQTGTEGRHSADAESTFDWSTGLTGTRIGQTADLAGLYIAEKNRLRNARRTKTAALRRHDARARASGHLLRARQPALRRQLSGDARHDAGRQHRRRRIVNPRRPRQRQGRDRSRPSKSQRAQPCAGQSQSARRKSPTGNPISEKWARRTEIFDKAQQTTPFLTPTLLKRQEEASSEAGDRLSIQPPHKYSGASGRRFDAPIFADMAV